MIPVTRIAPVVRGLVGQTMQISRMSLMIQGAWAAELFTSPIPEQNTMLMVAGIWMKVSIPFPSMTQRPRDMNPAKCVIPVHNV